MKRNLGFISLVSLFSTLILVACGSEDGGPGVDPRITAVDLTNFGISGSSSSRIQLGVQSGNKVLVVGDTAVDDPNVDEFGTRVARFNSDGTLDESFGTDGIATIIDTSRNLRPYGVVALSNGGLIIVGETQLYPVSTSSRESLLIKLLSNGDIDTTFGTNGIVVNASNNANHVEFYQAVAQADNKIVLLASDREILRIDTDGTLDNTFGVAGVVNVGSDDIESLALQADGKIIAVGQRDSSMFDAYAVKRFNTDGTLDTTFADMGTLSVTKAAASSPNLDAVLVQSDGMIIAVGGYRTPSRITAEVIRIDQNGVLDNSFSSEVEDAYGDSIVQLADDSLVFHIGGLLIQADSTGNVINTAYPTNDNVGAENDLVILGDETLVAYDRFSIFFITPE